jgi:hypothetical protein
MLANCGGLRNIFWQPTLGTEGKSILRQGCQEIVEKCSKIVPLGAPLKIFDYKRFSRLALGVPKRIGVIKT